MKKIMKTLVKGLSLLLAVIMSMAIVGCGPSTNDPTANAKEPELIYFGQHDYTAPDIEDKWLVKDGKTEYKVVVPADTKEVSKLYYNYIVNEFVGFFEKSTGIALQVLVDDGLSVKTHQPDQYYISLDDTTLFDSLKGTENEIDCSVGTVTTNGGKIVTVDNNIYINGFSDKGTLNMVYTFLRITFNWETYSANTTVYDENVTDKNLKAYDVFDIPDIEYSVTSGYERQNIVLNRDYSYKIYHPTEGGYMYGPRVLCNAEGELTTSEIFEESVEEMYNDIAKYSSLDKPSGHSSVHVVDYDDWAISHPKWFGNTKGIQLCYTCDGDQEEFELVTDYLAKMCELALMKKPRDLYPHANSVDVSISDDRTMCTCDTCAREKVKYDDSGLLVKYFNRVAEKVEAWMNLPENEPYKRDDFVIKYFAYYSTETPPAKLNAQGEWVPVDDTVKLHKNTCVKYTPIAADYQQSVFASGNKTIKDMFDGWAACATSVNNIGYMFFNYNCNYHNYFYDGFDWFNTKGLNYHFAKGRAYYYAENLHGTTPTEWGALISYVNAKLCYDSTLDSGELINNWFNAVFGPAAPVMFDMFMSIRLFTHNETLRMNGYRIRSNRNQVEYLFFWRQGVIENWLAKAEQGLDIIEPLKITDPDEYYRIKYNIELEMVSPFYMLMAANGDTKRGDINVSQAAKDAFKARVQENLILYPEYKYIDVRGSFIGNWVESF